MSAFIATGVMTYQLRPIGTIRTPYRSLDECPRNTIQGGAFSRIVIDPEWSDGLFGLAPGDAILVLYWLDRASLGKLRQTSRMSGETRGIFALRTPRRPNPLGAAVVTIDDIEENEIHVRGLDCLDGTPLIDIKPAMAGESADEMTAS